MEKERKIVRTENNNMVRKEERNGEEQRNAKEAKDIIEQKMEHNGTEQNTN